MFFSLTICVVFIFNFVFSVISSVCWHLYIYIVKRRRPLFVGGAIEIPLIDWSELKHFIVWIKVLRRINPQPTTAVRYVVWRSGRCNVPHTPPHPPAFTSTYEYAAARPSICHDCYRIGRVAAAWDGADEKDIHLQSYACQHLLSQVLTPSVGT